MKYAQYFQLLFVTCSSVPILVFAASSSEKGSSASVSDKSNQVNEYTGIPYREHQEGNIFSELFPDEIPPPAPSEAGTHSSRLPIRSTEHPTYYGEPSTALPTWLRARIPSDSTPLAASKSGSGAGSHADPQSAAQDHPQYDTHPGAHHRSGEGLELHQHSGSFSNYPRRPAPWQFMTYGSHPERQWSRQPGDYAVKQESHANSPAPHLPRNPFNQSPALGQPDLIKVKRESHSPDIGALHTQQDGSHHGADKSIKQEEIPPTLPPRVSNPYEHLLRSHHYAIPNYYATPNYNQPFIYGFYQAPHGRTQPPT